MYSYGAFFLSTLECLFSLAFFVLYQLYILCEFQLREVNIRDHFNTNGSIKAFNQILTLHQ